MDAMKSMKLYDHVDRIPAELRALGFGDSDPLNVEALSTLDQFHYHGVEAVNAAMERCGIGPKTRVLEVGAGVGGPARWIAAKSGAVVAAVELQRDLNDLAQSLTRRCGLDDRVRHLCADILAGPPKGAPFDCVTSFLCFLHIANRPQLFGVLNDSLAAGGTLYVEDFVALREPTPDEARALAVKVQCPWLPTAAQYRDDLARHGFIVEDLADRSVDWTAFTNERLGAFRANRARFVALHGKECFDGLEDFYAAVAGLFANGSIGGVTIVARKA
ncbi:MAG: methyltransferase domain-containing protein [Hyphomicrobiales bacterium]